MTSAQCACEKAAVWNGLCADHGGVLPSADKLMKLLAEVTGCSLQTLVVETKFVETVYQISRSDTRVVPIWTVSTITSVVLGKLEVSAHASSYEMALWLLALEVGNRLEYLADAAKGARAKLDQFQKV